MTAEIKEYKTPEDVRPSTGVKPMTSIGLMVQLLLSKSSAVLTLNLAYMSFSIDLFRLYTLFSHFRPRDALMGIFLSFFH